MQFVVFTDGGSRGNPGPSACAFVVFSNTQQLFAVGNFLGKMTNNEAEYEGMLKSVRWISNLPTLGHSVPSAVKWQTDSLLMASQLQRKWKIKEPRLRKYAEEIWQLFSLLQCQYSIEYVPREENSIADALVNKTLDDQLTTNEA